MTTLTNTTSQPISKSLGKLFKQALDHTSLKGRDLNDPKVQQFIKKRNAENEEAAVMYASKQFYIQRVSKPFMNYSIYDDDSLKKASFSNYDPSFSKEAKKNYFKAGEIAHQYYEGKEFNTFILGPCGRGKSHLALSIVKSVLKTKKPLNSAIFVDVNEMMQRIKDSFNTNESIKNRVEERLKNAYLIVLDDLGAEKVSEFDTEMLLEIINSQHRIIFTTNLMPDEIKNTYGERIYSRMRRGSKDHIIQFTKDTEDHRAVEL